MALEENKLYNISNASQALHLIGGRGYFANTVADMEQRRHFFLTESDILIDVLSTDEERRFVNKEGERWALFYFVCRKKDKKFIIYVDEEGLLRAPGVSPESIEITIPEGASFTLEEGVSVKFNYKDFMENG